MKGYLLCLAIVAFACKETPPGPPLPQSPLALAVEDVGVTEAWLRLGLSAEATPRTVELKRKGHLVQTLTLTTSDTVIIADSLLPGQTYVFTAFWSSDATHRDSAGVQVITMDTTSHNFTWHTDKWGFGSSSALYDVAIINDTLAYAVGEVYLPDSLGQPDGDLYNLATYDGSSWKFQKLYYQGGLAPITAIHAFSKDDVWLGIGYMLHWDGTQYREVEIPGYHSRVNKIWGASSRDLYIVGEGGLIYQYNGTAWHQIESGTTSDLTDVWGGSNRSVGSNVVIITAANKYTEGETKFLRIRNGMLDSLSWPLQLYPRLSVWFTEHSMLYSGGGGIFRHNGVGWKYFAELPLVYTNRIRGTAENNIIAGGDFGLLMHFNGASWHVYDELSLSTGNYESVAVKGNTVISVGWQGSKAVAAVGRQN